MYLFDSKYHVMHHQLLNQKNFLKNFDQLNFYYYNQKILN